MTVIRAGSASVCRTTSERVASLGAMSASARRDETDVQARKNRALTPRCSSGWLKNVASCSVTTCRGVDAEARRERHRVVRRVQDVRLHTADDERQPGLLPGQPRRGSGGPARGEVDAILAEHRPVVGPIARLGQDVRVDAEARQPHEDFVDVAADPAVVLR